MSLRYLLAIDPGLDATGWAAFRRPAGLGLLAPSLLAAAKLDSGVWPTSPRDDLGDRLVQLQTALGATLEHLTVRGAPCEICVAIEVPAIAGVYGGETETATLLRRTGGLTLMAYATGALLAAARSGLVALGPRGVVGAVYPVKAPGVAKMKGETAKAAKRRQVRRYWPGLAGQDQLDALYLGVVCLSNPSLLTRIPNDGPARRARPGVRSHGTVPAASARPQSPPGARGDRGAGPPRPPPRAPRPPDR